MGAIWVPSMGNVADLDVVTAESGDVLSGKVIVDKDGNPLIGTMPDNSTRTSNGNVPGINSAYPDLATREGINLQICEDTNGTRRINMVPPKGYYNGEVYVNRPASDFGNAPASAIDPDYTATSQNGLNMRGTMPTMGGQEITPATYQQTVSCNGKKMTGDVTVNPIPNYHGTDSICLGGWMNYDTGYAFFRMLNGYYEKYSNGDEPATAHTFADVAGIIGLTPDMIFKGKACLGINGTAEGYTTYRQWIYAYPNEVHYNSTSNIVFNNGWLTVMGGTSGIYLTEDLDIAHANSIIMKMKQTSAASFRSVYVDILFPPTGSYFNIGHWDVYQMYTASEHYMDISMFSMTTKLRFRFPNGAIDVEQISIW